MSGQIIVVRWRERPGECPLREREGAAANVHWERERGESRRRGKERGREREGEGEREGERESERETTGRKLICT